MKRAIIVFIFALAISSHSCQRSTSSDKTLIVSILPLKYIIDNLTDGDFNVEVLVPPGASPETYEPVPQQIMDIERSQLVFTTGLMDFEQALVNKLSDSNEKIINLSADIETIKCNYSHGDHVHAHGVDPHIWTSPTELVAMAATAYRAISALYPDSVRYTANLRNFVTEMAKLDIAIKNKIENADLKYFIIYHPALTYYSTRYNIEQVSLEDEGKEPSADRLKQIIDRGRADGVKYVFYQSQFSKATVESVAGNMGAQAVEIDPLREDVGTNLLEITDLITRR